MEKEKDSGAAAKPIVDEIEESESTRYMMTFLENQGKLGRPNHNG